jgi:hypothetical protein
MGRHCRFPFIFYFSSTIYVGHLSDSSNIILNYIFKWLGKVGFKLSKRFLRREFRPKAIYRTFSSGTIQRRLTQLCNVNSWVSSNFYPRWPLLLKKTEISRYSKPDPCCHLSDSANIILNYIFKWLGTVGFKLSKRFLRRDFLNHLLLE